MNLLILDGATNGSPLTDLLTEIVSPKDHKPEVFRLHNMTVAPCMGCFGCWVSTPGICVIDDSGRTLATRFMSSDLVVMITPITFGGYSSHMKKALDRLIPLILPFFTTLQGETHHQRRYTRYPRLLTIGTTVGNNPASVNAFQRLMSRAALNLPTDAAFFATIDVACPSDNLRTELTELLKKVGASL